MKICIVVLQYDRGSSWKDTLDCVNTINKFESIDVLIVDNASPNGVDEIVSRLSLAPHFEEISNLYKRDNIYLIRLDNNYGYAGGNNRGFAISRQIGNYDYVWFMNNDVIVRDGSIDELLRFLNETIKYDSIGTTVLNYGSDIIQCAGGSVYVPLLAIGKPILSGENISEIYKENFDIPKADYYTGCSFIFKSSKFDEVRGFNEEYFLYFEEIDIFTRLNMTDDFHSIYLRNVIVEHKDGASINYLGRSVLSERHSTLSSLIFTKKYHKNILFPVVIVRTFYKTMRYIAALRFDLVKAHFRAMVDFFKEKV